MPALSLHIVISIVFLGISLSMAWKKRGWHAGLIFLFLGVFWFPSLTLYAFVTEMAGKGWEKIIISMTWLSSLMVLGLCLMYGSKRIHTQGRWMTILALIAIAGLLGALGWRG